MSRIHIVCKRTKGEALKIAEHILKEFEKGNEIILDEESARALNYDDCFEIEYVGEGADRLLYLEVMVRY